MPRLTYELNPVVRMTASAVGLPGQRTFYLQARDNERLLTLLCEKTQVADLVTAIETLADQVDEKKPLSSPSTPIPDEALELEEPLEPAFRIGQMGLGYDDEADAIVLVAYELPEAEDVDPDTLSVARFWIARELARAVARHAATVVASGRPICPLCGEPIDADGHICPKKNGHKKIETT